MAKLPALILAVALPGPCFAGPSGPPDILSFHPASRSPSRGLPSGARLRQARLSVGCRISRLQQLAGTHDLAHGEPGLEGLRGGSDSMGGYGVLTAAGASLDPTSPFMGMVPGAFLNPYARGGSKRDAVVVKGLRAVVAIAPAGGGSLAAWRPEGLRRINTPLLLISGNPAAAAGKRPSRTRIEPRAAGRCAPCSTDPTEGPYPRTIRSGVPIDQSACRESQPVSSVTAR
jgi:hypothetical protein